MKTSRQCVIKIGSNVLTDSEGNPAIETLSHLVQEVANLINQGIKVILVSSGAVAFGRREISLPGKLEAIQKKQIWAAIGQIALINVFKKEFKKFDIPVAQVLVTKEDFRDRKHYVNMKNCFSGLINNNILPIVNENDTVAITELMFTDNDELAGLTAAMINADTLVLLTNVDGIFDGPPESSDSQLIPLIKSGQSDIKKFISASRSSFGRGGMLTKWSIARKSAALGIQVAIANGKKANILSSLFGQGKGPYTYFEPHTKTHSPKKWLAHGEHYFRGEVTINQGAVDVLHTNEIRSLLPVGIISQSGDFQKGDIVLILGEAGQKIGLGKAAYSAATLAEKIGQKMQKPFIHYDYLYLFYDA